MVLLLAQTSFSCSASMVQQLPLVPTGVVALQNKELPVDRPSFVISGRNLRSGSGKLTLALLVCSHEATRDKYEKIINVHKETRFQAHEARHGDRVWNHRHWRKVSSSESNIRVKDR